jgi:hypothetical protein
LRRIIISSSVCCGKYGYIHQEACFDAILGVAAFRVTVLELNQPFWGDVRKNNGKSLAPAGSLDAGENYQKRNQLFEQATK